MRKIAGAFTIGLLMVAGCSSSSQQRSGTPTTGTRVADRIGVAAQLVADVQPAAPRAAAGTPVARSEQQFAVALLQQLASSDQNVTVSPSSLALALSMLENGASGATRTQIAAALQSSGLSAAAQNAGWHALLDQWAKGAASGMYALDIANAAWTQDGFPIKSTFLDPLARYYQAGVWRADFAGHNAAALKSIDDWTSAQTNGKIRKLFDHLDPSTKLVLANAAYFKARWAQTFDTHLTAAGSFTTANGSTVRVPLMHSSQLVAPAASTASYQAAELPYVGGRFAALAIVPTTGTLSSFVASLTSDRLNAIVSSLSRQPVDVVLPRFTTRSTLDLPPTLRALGMPDAFDPVKADFSALSPVARQVGLHVDQVIQRSYLSVTEHGTEAAAATGVSVVASSAVQSLPIRFDHPFLFLIRDQKTGAVLFASEINDPSSG